MQLVFCKFFASLIESQSRTLDAYLLVKLVNPGIQLGGLEPKVRSKYCFCWKCRKIYTYINPLDTGR